MAHTNHRQTLLKRNNRAQIMLGVHKRGPTSRAQLARATGLSMTCVCSIVSELLSEGILVETGTTTGQRGGPMVLLEINPNGAAVAGVWFSYEEIDTVIGNPAGDILARRNVGFDFVHSSPEMLINAMKNEIEKCAETAGKAVRSLQGIGLCIGSMVDPALGTILASVESYNQLDGVPIVRMLSDATGLPVYADNDVRAGSLAAAWLGDDARSGSTLYITVGKGTGCAFIRNNDILRGAHDMSCQFRRMIIDFTAPQAGDIHAGTMNSLVTDPAFIGAMWPDLAEAAATMPADESTELVRRGLEMALGGDGRAYAALARVTKCISVGVANLVNILDPRTVFIGGTLIDLAPEMTLDMIRAETLQLVSTRARGVEIRPLVDYKDFVLRGGIGLVLGQEYRVLQEDNLRTRVVARLKETI